MQERLTELKTRLQEVYDLHGAAALLYWDQATYMPPGGAETRGQQLATLSRLAQEKFTSPALGQLLEDLQPYQETLPYDNDEASLVRVTRREYERATKLPPAFVAELSSHAARSYQAWTVARPANDFAAMQPLLEKTLELSRRAAEYFGWPAGGHIADPLINEADYGMTVAMLRPLFAALREQLTPLVEAIQAQPAPDDSFLYRHYPEQQQWDFGVDVVKRFGYDFQRGRQDKTHHPFMIKFGPGDVRITTRFREDDLGDGLFSTMHESGHAMYEQGINPAFGGTPLGGGTSAGVHESQSRLWENLVGRSRPFWSYYYPQLQAIFPQQLGEIPLDAFYRAINKVRPSLVRVDADEVTYNLHVIIRFDLELALLEGTLAVKDLPEAWRASYREALGVDVPDDRDGVLQDMHWYYSQIGGGFQGYTLGNILSAAFWQAANAAHPEIGEQIAQGQFDTLRGWLRERIYQHGSKFTAPLLVEQVTGAPLTIDPYIAYLKGKYGELYGL
ncbi:MAG: carboxypeptidase M32 [Anaerolineae bacterium]